MYIVRWEQKENCDRNLHGTLNNCDADGLVTLGDME